MLQFQQFQRSMVFKAPRPGFFRSSTFHRLILIPRQGRRLALRITPGETRVIEELAGSVSTSGLESLDRELAQQFQTEVPLGPCQSRTDQPYNGFVGHCGSAHKPTVPKVPVPRHTSDEARSRAFRQGPGVRLVSGHRGQSERFDLSTSGPNSAWGDGTLVRPPSRNDHCTPASARKISLVSTRRSSFRFFPSPAGDERSNYGALLMSPVPGPYHSPLTRSSSCSSTRPEVRRASELCAIRPRLTSTLSFQPEVANLIRVESIPRPEQHQFIRPYSTTSYSLRHYSSISTKASKLKGTSCYYEKPSNTSSGLKIYHKMLSAPLVNRTGLHPGGVAPIREHTEIEEELHEKANIDYDHVCIIENPSVAVLYEDALVYETGTAITSSGALTAYSGSKTGRSPKDKRIVQEPGSEKEVWWGPVNKPMSPEVWRINRERAIDYLNTRKRIYVVDGYAGWDPRYRISVRVVCARAYHALFMRNMLIRPTQEELKTFHPDYTIYNAGGFPANRYTEGMTSTTSVAINFAEKELVILGTEYAGEMKKGILTVFFYEMPVLHNVLTLHSSANVGKNGDVSVFFGLSGTGKTTLSADPQRALIGDDEHCWTDTGIFNVEGGCYAKAINLSAEKEPEIFNAIRFGTVLENVVFDPNTRVVDYDDTTLTENTRAAYPIEYIPNALIPCVAPNHPTNIILLCCDARGALPPISKLNPEQVMYHFISGYTSKVAGTEEGVTEPTATFSACFAQPFLALPPIRYARMLAEKIKENKANAWLLNTGWIRGAAGKGGERCPLKYTRAILDAVHNGELVKQEYESYPVFNLSIPKSCPGVPAEILNPKRCWTAGEEDYKQNVHALAKLFTENFQLFSADATEEVIAAGPQI